MSKDFSRQAALGRSRRKHRPASFPRMQPEADPSLRRVFAGIGRPAPTPFQADPFQMEALEAVRTMDCIVAAPTGSGKTWIAEQAMDAVLRTGGRCWYASPLKALSNAKWVEFGQRFGEQNVGIVTGDVRENADAPILVGTTEILRNQLYDAMHKGADLPCNLVILDEAHYLGDRDRGVVWEEILIYLPARIHLLLLSATIGNCDEIAAWLSDLRGKLCRVVPATERPVPLHPLFLHPSGRLLPCVEKSRLHPKVKAFLDEGIRQPFHGGLGPPFGQILEVLRTFDLLPAIFFLKSRSECDGALKACRFVRPRPDDGTLADDLDDLLECTPYLTGHRQLHDLRTKRIAAHHGGQLPAWKFLVESMMKRGHLDAIFATSTVAAGVNFPARTIVLFNSDLFNGRDFSPLNGTEFHQMTGRAGRRGLDKIGFLLLVPGRFMDMHHVRSLLFRGAEDIQSRIRSDFSMVLNLLLSQTPDDIRRIFERSLAVRQNAQRRKGAASGASLWEDFQRQLRFLKAEGFVDAADRLTENGRWAAKLRLDQPLLIAECIRRDAFPEDERLLAALMAPFVYDGDQDYPGSDRHPPRRLVEAFRTVATAVRPLTGRLTAAGFPVGDFYFWTARVMHDWARGKAWEDIVRDTGITDGDLAMLVLRTADNLRQLGSLKDTHPRLAVTALSAAEAILRDPVVFE